MFLYNIIISLIYFINITPVTWRLFWSEKLNENFDYLSEFLFRLALNIENVGAIEECNNINTVIIEPHASKCFFSS